MTSSNRITTMFYVGGALQPTDILGTRAFGLLSVSTRYGIRVPSRAWNVATHFYALTLNLDYKEVYVSSTKKQKMAISRSIVEAVRSLVPPGRFLEKNPRTGLWSDIGHKKAVEKTSQALRDGAASLRKQLSADLGDPDFLNAVFDIDVVEKDKKINQAASNEETKEKAGDKIRTRGKENNKLKSIEKTRAFKVSQ